MKTVNGPEEVLKHFAKYPEIPIAIPDHIASNDRLEPFLDRILPFSELGIDYQYIRDQTRRQMEEIAHGFFGSTIYNTDIVTHGFDTQAIHGITDGYHGFHTPDIGGVHLPILGMSITALLSGRRMHQLFIKGEISLPSAINTVGGDLGAATVRGMASFATSSLIASNVLGYGGGTTEVFHNGFNAGNDLFAGDWDIDDIWSLGEFALVIGAGYLAAKGVQKIFKLLRGDPLKGVKKAENTLTIHLEELYTWVIRGDNQEYILDIMGRKQFNEQRIIIKRIKHRLIVNYNKRSGSRYLDFLLKNFLKVG